MVKVKCLLSCLLVLFIVSGCKMLMPSRKEITKSPWSTYHEIMLTFNKIEPGITKFSDLQKIGLDPSNIPNTVYLNPLSVRNLFLPDSPIIKMEHLPEGVQECLKNFDKCFGYKFRLRNVNKKGTGSLFLRMTGFKKKDLTTGLDVSFYVFFVDNIVVYKLAPEGTPYVYEMRTKKNPLGPLQEPASLLRSGVESLATF